MPSPTPVLVELYGFTRADFETTLDLARLALYALVVLGGLTVFLLTIAAVGVLRR